VNTSGAQVGQRGAPTGVPSKNSATLSGPSWLELSQQVAVSHIGIASATMGQRRA
jgi:hypothetical protein